MTNRESVFEMFFLHYTGHKGAQPEKQILAIMDDLIEWLREIRAAGFSAQSIRDYAAENKKEFEKVVKTRLLKTQTPEEAKRLAICTCQTVLDCAADRLAKL